VGRLRFVSALLINTRAPATSDRGGRFFAGAHRDFMSCCVRERTRCAQARCLATETRVGHALAAWRAIDVGNKKPFLYFWLRGLAARTSYGTTLTRMETRSELGPRPRPRRRSDCGASAAAATAPPTLTLPTTGGRGGVVVVEAISSISSLHAPLRRNTCLSARSGLAPRRLSLTVLSPRCAMQTAFTFHQALRCGRSERRRVSAAAARQCAQAI
jgi:hypothetical protein